MFYLTAFGVKMPSAGITESNLLVLFDKFLWSHKMMVFKEVVLLIAGLIVLGSRHRHDVLRQSHADEIEIHH
jgi:hypothetical protein